MDTMIFPEGRSESAKTPAEICRTVNADFKLQGITHAEAAQRLGVERRSVSNQLSGKRPFTKKGALRYAQVFGYDETFLLFGKGELRKRQQKKKALIETLASQYSERQNAGLLEEVHAMYTKLQELQTQLLRAEESNRRLEEKILLKDGEIARLIATKRGKTRP